jgi:hypothetical protein
MATGGLTQLGLSDALTSFTTSVSGTPFQVGLYTNNYVILPTSTISNITEASFSGYARVNIGSTLPPVWDSGTNSYTQQFAPIVFTYTGGSTSGAIYGWFCVDNSGNLVCGDLLYTSGQVLSPSFPSIQFIPAFNCANG